MDKDTAAIWTVIGALVGAGGVMTGLGHIYIGYICFLFAAALVIYQLGGLCIRKINRLIPLSQPIEKLIKKGLEQGKIPQLGYDLDIQNNADKYYQPFIELLAKYIPIYGKRPGFDEYERINDNKLLRGKYSNWELYLPNYIERGPEFISLAVKKRESNKAINKIMSLYRPFDWSSYEVKEERTQN